MLPYEVKAVYDETTNILPIIHWAYKETYKGCKIIRSKYKLPKYNQITPRLVEENNCHIYH